MKNILLLGACAFALASLSVAQQKPKIDFSKKIADATPKSLPQNSTVKKLSSDANDDNLKGKVKSVIEYSQEAGKAREISSEEYFDENGNLVKGVSYEEGYPEGVAVWGYIDDERVSMSGDVQYNEGERPASKRFLIKARAEDNALNPDAARDRRYSMKHRFAYDGQGRLVETIDYQNNGEVWHRVKYAYKGNQKEARDYDARGNEMSRTIYVLDKNGDTAEEWMFGADENDIMKEFYSHILDANSNWIEEKVFEPKKIHGKTVMKLLWTTYRTITYYP